MNIDQSRLPEDLTSPSSRPVVLLADDDEAFRKAVASLLHKSGYNVALAANGHEALALLKQHPVQVAILDLIMPQMEGIETILRIRALDVGIKVVAISGGGRIGNDNYLGIARKLGADAVLAKPFSGDLLLKAVSKAMSPDLPTASIDAAPE